jgi:hypothetical protein
VIHYRRQTLRLARFEPTLTSLLEACAATKPAAWSLNLRGGVLPLDTGKRAVHDIYFRLPDVIAAGDAVRYIAELVRPAAP